MLFPLLTIPKDNFIQGVVKCKDYSKFSNLGVFVNKDPDEIDLTLNSVLTVIVLSYKGRYLVNKSGDKHNLCGLRHVTSYDDSLNIIESAFNNHIEILDITTKDRYNIGYIHNILKYKNRVFFLKVVSLTNMIKGYSSYCLQQLAEDYFLFNDISRDVINHVYDNTIYP